MRMWTTSACVERLLAANQAATGRPAWLIAVLAAAVLTGATLLARLGHIGLRRRGAPKGKARIVLADYDRLVVTWSRSAGGDTICVLRPPGEDPTAILRAARLVLEEEAYRDLWHQLSVPADWLTD